MYVAIFSFHLQRFFVTRIRPSEDPLEVYFVNVQIQRILVVPLLEPLRFILRLPMKMGNLTQVVLRIITMNNNMESIMISTD